MTIRLAALLLLAGVAGLAAVHAWDAASYLALRRALGLAPFAPFLDMHGVMAAIACHHQGVDVYAANPCDALGRLHIYSPLWLRLPAWLGRAELRDLFGLLTGLGFAAALLLLPALPRGGPALAATLAILSPVSVFLLERANIDAAIFALALAGTALLGRALPWRLTGYGLFTLAALMKFYPVVLLALLVRERWRVAAAAGAAAAAVLLAAAVPLRGEVLRAVAQIETLPAFAGAFGAPTLGKGIAALHPQLAPVAAALAAAALLAGALWLGRDAGLGRRLAALPAERRHFLLAGGLVVVGCFAAGESVEYRAVFLIPTLPALATLARDGARAGLFAGLCWAEAWLLWDPLLRRVVGWLAPAEGGLPSAPSLVLWGVREGLWWGVVAALLGLVLAALRPGLTRPVPPAASSWPLQGNIR